MSQLEGQSTTPQIILAAGTQNSGSLPLQQLLIPVSAGSGVSGGGGGIQQLISVPVPVGAATATGPVQLLATPGGQLINVANTPHLNVAVPSPGLWWQSVYCLWWWLMSRYFTNVDLSCCRISSTCFALWLCNVPLQHLRNCITVISIIIMIMIRQLQSDIHGGIGGLKNRSFLKVRNLSIRWCRKVIRNLYFMFSTLSGVRLVFWVSPSRVFTTRS